MTVSSPGVPFKGGCLCVDTSFAVDPLVSEGEETRDKMLVFSMKGFRDSEHDEESAIRLGSFSFRCLHSMSDTPVGQASRIFKVAVDSSSLHLGSAIIVSLSVKCFPMWMAPAFDDELDGIINECDSICDATLKEALARLANLSQEYIAARSLLSSGCSNGSIALLDPIFRSSANLSARELLFPSPPFPKCIVDPSFSAIMAPAVLQESIAVTIWKYYKLTRSVHLKHARTMKATASCFINRITDDAAFTYMQLAFKAWANRCKERQRIECCAYFLNRNRQRYHPIVSTTKKCSHNSADTNVFNRSTPWHTFKTAFRLWKNSITARTCVSRRILCLRFYCFYDWKSHCIMSKVRSIEIKKNGSEARLKDAQMTIKESERQIVLLKSKIAELSASSVLMQDARPGHLQQLHVSRSAELSAIYRAEQAEEVLAAVQIENELLKEQLEAQRELMSYLSSSETSVSLQLKELNEIHARVQTENERLLEENNRLRDNAALGASERQDLAAQVQSLTAALKQQVAMMMKRAAVTASSNRN